MEMINEGFNEPEDKVIYLIWRTQKIKIIYIKKK